MTASAVACVRNLIEQYRRFLLTSYRFLDPGLHEQFVSHISEADVIIRGPYVTLSREFVRGKPLCEIVQEGHAEAALLKLNWPFADRPLYAHQQEALAIGRSDHSFVVTTGTGSGKTEAFLLPVLDGILRRKRAGISGVQAILMYPMNALANDQLERLRRLVRAGAPGSRGVDISFGLYTGDSDEASKKLREDPAETERTSRMAIRRDPPDILLTNYKQLEFLLVRSEDRKLFGPSLRYLVLDELHSYRGALATEIACLIRRLKAHAGIAAGHLIGIGTSATVASGEEGRKGLADFASLLFSEPITPERIIGETTVPLTEDENPWTPPPPLIEDVDLSTFNPDEEGDARSSAIRLTEALIGRSCAPAGTLPQRIAESLRGNSIVRTLEETFAAPASISRAVEVIKERYADRNALDNDRVRREVEAYLLAGSVGDEKSAPRLRPKLHTFFHGVYDIWLCLNPECRRLIPQGGTECPHCGAAARPVAICRTCGQDFVKVRTDDDGEAGAPGSQTVGTGDFYSNEKTAFLTSKLHPLIDDDDEEQAGAGAPGSDSIIDENPEEGEKRAEPVRKPLKKKKKPDAGAPGSDERLEKISLCFTCGRLLPEGADCQVCNKVGIPYLIHRGPIHTCPACGDTYPRADIVTPLRTGTASTTSVLVSHHLDLLQGEDRKLLLFADNRQDTAHQAGYTQDKQRSIALKHLMAHEVHDVKPGAQGTGVYLQDLPERLIDGYRKLRIITGRLSQPEIQKWREAFLYLAACEFSRNARQRASLENLGLVQVDYEFLDDLPKDSEFIEIMNQFRLKPLQGITLVRAILDVMRKRRAIGIEFFQDYIDPNQKRRYRELEAEPYSVRFPDRDRKPVGFALDRPDHVRKACSGSVMGFYQENPKSGGLTAIQKLVKRIVGAGAPGNRQKSGEFIQRIIPVLKRLELLVSVPHFPLPKNARVASMQILQINAKMIRLAKPDGGYRCAVCQHWYAYDFPCCPTPKCGSGQLKQTSLDESNYYVRLYTERMPQRLTVAEHSGQIAGTRRAELETEFKENRLDVLVCTPTLELGVDIGPLLTVVLRNAPPTPANYIQRVGRAGRRLRIGFVSTFCAGGAHDRHAFEHPEWLVAGHFSPPRLRLDNPRIVDRHLRSYLLECVDPGLPALMGEFLDDQMVPTRWLPEKLADLFTEIRRNEEQLLIRLRDLFAADREAGCMSTDGLMRSDRIVKDFEPDMTAVLERWWTRVRQLDREYREFATIGSPRADEKKAAARKHAYYEITQDRERAYVLNFLATQGVLPAYQFPVDTFSLDPGVVDTPTLHRPAAIAIEEFAPGNFVYANGHKLKSIRVLFAAGAPGSGPVRGAGEHARTDASGSGRLRAFQFCRHCEDTTEVSSIPLNNCRRCNGELDKQVECLFINAFEAEESLKIGSDEESRQKQFFVRHESLISEDDVDSRVYPYPFAPMAYGRLGKILVTNWGRAEARTREARKFWICPDCGRHQPYDPLDAAHTKELKKWQDYHARFCSGQPREIVLGHEFHTDCLVLSVPSYQDKSKIGVSEFSPFVVTMTEALLAGAASLLELESYELSAFPRLSPEGSDTEEIVFYETVPGGAGYIEDIARRLPEIAAAARSRLYEHSCAKACYLCLKHYRNQRWHAFFDKDRVRDFLFELSTMERVAPVVVKSSSRNDLLRASLQERREELNKLPRKPGEKGPQTPIEERLWTAIHARPGMPVPIAQHEIVDGSKLLTIPDFAYLEQKIAVYCDGFAFHGNPDTLELDARKRNRLQELGWVVLTYWGRTILRAPDKCAEEIHSVLKAKTARL